MPARPAVPPLLAPGLLAALLAGLCAAACGGARETGPVDPAVKLFRKARCDSCHGRAGEGLPRMGPRLADIARNWTRQELVEYIRNPAPFREERKPHLIEISQRYFSHMRPFPELAPDERGVLADWLLLR